MSQDNVVVGVDGGAGALRAVRWAARECAADAETLVLVHALGYRAGTEPRDTEEVLSAAVTAARTSAAGVKIRRRPERGNPVAVLAAAGDSARLIVLGSNGATDVAASMLGSVGHRVAAHARCPVVIVPLSAEPACDRGAVVVGLAPGRAGRAALRFALAHAARRGDPVEGVWAMQNADGARSTASRAVLPPELRSILAEQPQVPFRLRRIDADPAAALTTTGSDAALLVLGCHHSDEPWSTRLGPVPTALLSRAALPVVLVGCAAR